MTNVTSQPVQRPADVGQEYLVNGARQIPITEQLTSNLRAAFQLCYWALKKSLDVMKFILETPISLAASITPERLKVWLTEHLQSLRNFLSKITVKLNRNEIDELNHLLADKKETFEALRHRIAALPEAAQREFNKVFLTHQTEHYDVIDRVAGVVNGHLDHQRAIYNQMAIDVRDEAAPQHASFSTSITAPAPAVPTALRTVASPPVRPTSSHCVRTPAEIEAEIDRLKQELASLQAEPSPAPNSVSRGHQPVQNSI